MTATESDWGGESTDLNALRAEIGEIDVALIDLLARRVATARRVGTLKRGAHLPRLDPAREAEVIRRGVEHAREVGLDEEAVREILWHTVGLCRRAQGDG